MKKSKFLKKSLAMLLALMLVVAMIPLSASAADPLPALTFISVNDVQIAAEDTSFSATYPETATSVNLKATVPSGTELYAVNKDEVQEEKVTSSNKSFSFDLFDSDPSEDVVKIVLKLKSATPSDGREEVEYTLTLTPKANSTENGVKGIERASDAKDYGLMSVSYDDDTQVVTVTAAYGYDATNGKIEVTPVETASVNGGVKGASAKIALSAKKFNIVSEDNEATPWNIEVNEVPTLTAFSIAGKTGEFSEEKSNKVGKNDTITVTLGLDDIKNQYGEIDISDPIFLNVGYTVYDNTKVGSDDTQQTSNMGALFNSGSALGFTFSDQTTYYSATKYVQVKTGNQSNVYEYTVNVVVPKSNDTSVLFASIGNVEATVSGNAISAVLDKTAFSTQDIVLHLPKGASVTDDDISPNFSSPNTSHTDYDVWSVTGVDLSTPKVIVITAADGKTSKQYSVSITKSSTAGQALLTNFTLKDTVGNTYKTTVNQDTRTITSEALPYMTTSLDGWTMFPVVSDGARATLGDTPTAIISGQTKFDDVGVTGLTASGWTDGDAKTVGKVTVVNQGEGGQTTEYTLKVTFQKGNTNNTLKDVTVAAVDTTNITTEKLLVRNLTKQNTYTGTLDTATDPANPQIKVKTSFTHKSGGTYGLYISNLNTNGGVAYFYNSGSQLAAIQIPDESRTTALQRNLYATVPGQITGIVVLPEAIAKKYAAEIATKGYSFTNTQIPAADMAKGTKYEFDFSNEDASTEALLKTLKVGDTTLKVGSGAGTISGTIPYSMTVDASVVDTSSSTASVGQNLGYYLDFTLSDYATLVSACGTSGSQDVDFVKNGDKNLNGQPDDNADNDNAKLLFVRDEDNKVKVYVLNGTTTTMTDPADYIIDENNPLVVTSEKGSPDINDYIFNLTYANAQTEAKVTSFKLGNTSGTISGQTITVAMPFGSEVDALVPTFTLSTGATAYVNGVKLVSGETVLDCTNDVKIKVLSEDGKTSNIYTLKVTVSAQFSDIKESDWYYDNVMRAVELGILSGYTDGTFRPMNNITRRDFAIMLAQALGNSNDNDGTAVSRFPDVADDDYGVVSINYLYDNEITVGDEKGNFNPDANITRQEAAIFLAKAFEATGTTSETFTDDAKIASWAKSFVYAAKAAGLMNGDVNGAFRPNDKLTRAEAASVMVNAVDK